MQFRWAILVCLIPAGPLLLTSASESKTLPSKQEKARSDRTGDPIPEARTEWPKWESGELVQNYAAKIGLPTEISLKLADATTLPYVPLGPADESSEIIKMRLIPPGRYRMGIEDPHPINYSLIDKGLLTAKCTYYSGTLVLIALCLPSLLGSFRRRRLPTISLIRFVTIPVAIGIILLGFLWRNQNLQRLKELETELLLQQKDFNQSDENERPAHWVNLSKPFYISQFEITQEQYWAVAKLKPSSDFHGWGLNQPVENVRWEEASYYCQLMNRLDPGTELGLVNWVVRLPTEAEWEYVAREGKSGSRSIPPSELDAVGWYRGNSKLRVNPVGQKEPNAFGVYDLMGNVREWCLDTFRQTYYTESPDIDPLPSLIGDAKVIRGSDCFSESQECRITRRSHYHFASRSNSIGFRIVLAPPDQ